MGVIHEEADESNILTVWLAITEATEENGCMAVVPRSHKGQLALHCPIAGQSVTIPETRIPGEPLPLPMQPGDVLLATTKNLTAEREALLKDKEKKDLLDFSNAEVNFQEFDGVDYKALQSHGDMEFMSEMQDAMGKRERAAGSYNERDYQRVLRAQAAAILGCVIAVVSVPLLGFDLDFSNTDSVRVRSDVARELL